MPPEAWVAVIDRGTVDATRQLRLRARATLANCTLYELRLTAVEASDSVG